MRFVLQIVHVALVVSLIYATNTQAKVVWDPDRNVVVKIPILQEATKPLYHGLLNLMYWARATLTLPYSPFQLGLY